MRNRNKLPPIRAAVHDIRHPAHGGIRLGQLGQVPTAPTTISLMINVDGQRRQRTDPALPGLVGAVQRARGRVEREPAGHEAACFQGGGEREGVGCVVVGFEGEGVDVPVVVGGVEVVFGYWSCCCCEDDGGGGKGGDGEEEEKREKG